MPQEKTTVAFRGTKEQEEALHAVIEQLKEAEE